MQRSNKALVASGVSLVCLVSALVVVTRNARVAPDTMLEAASMQILTTSPGHGQRAAEPGETVSVKYSGKLDDGSIFDSGDIDFKLGVGQVIKGWDKGIAGMKVGEKRHLVIPPNDAYGSQGAGGGKIPPNAQLTFDVQLLAIK